MAEGSGNANGPAPPAARAPLPAPPSGKTDSVMPPTTGMLRRLVPVAAFFMAFATVMTLLLVYMDTTAIRHHQFRINMTQDYDLANVAQDDPQLIMYIREMHMRKAVDPHHYELFNATAYGRPTERAIYIAKLFNNKKYGVFVEVGAYKYNRLSDTEWLERNLSWSGLLVQPDPRDYFNLRKHGREQSQSIHACLSPTCYPKEVTYHQDERDGVKINSVHANSLNDDEWFNTRVKCFPLFSLLLAINTTSVDYLSLDTDGTELQVLDTLPFERVSIEIIDVHVPLEFEDSVDVLKKEMTDKNYTYLQNFRSNYVFKLNPTKM